MIGRLNHVGVATPSIEDSVAIYRDLLGATKAHAPFDLPAQGVRVCFIDVPNSQVELIEPLRRCRFLSLRCVWRDERRDARLGNQR